MATRRLLLLGTVTAISAAILGSCTNNSPKPSTSSAGGLSITLYSARHYEADNQVYAKFLEKTGIKVNLVEAKAEELIERIKSEGANSPADVVITVDAGNLYQAKKAGILQPLESAVLTQAIPANLRDPEGHWFGVTKRSRVIMYNKDKVKPDKIKTYEDLAKADLGYKVLVRSSSNVYNQSLVGSVLAAKGEAATEEWVKGLTKNFGRAPEGNDTAQIKGIASGLGDLAISNLYYLVRLAKSAKPEEVAIANKIGVIFPNQADRGAHVNISGAGIAKNAPHRAEALKFIEFLVSAEAQSIFAGSNNEYPVVASVPTDSKLASYGTFKADPLSASTIGENNQKALTLMDRAGWK
jgi:iron(III) transport system substrate-binding protein